MSSVGMTVSATVASSCPGFVNVPDNNPKPEPVPDAPSTVFFPFTPIFFIEEPSFSVATFTTVKYQNIGFMDCYKNWSAEELRLKDYGQGCRGLVVPGSTPATTNVAEVSNHICDTFASNPGFGSTGHLVSAADAQRPLGTGSSRSYTGSGQTQSGGVCTSSAPLSAGPVIFKEANSLPDTFNTGSAGEIRSGDIQQINEANEVKWLRNGYSGNTTIAVKCGSDDQSYVFPREVLERSFEYFRKSPQPDQTTGHHVENIEKEHTCVHLQQITTLSFARLIRWPQMHPSSRPNAADPKDLPDVDDLLSNVVSGDYLGFVDREAFETHISCLLATVMLKDRRKLTSAHIELVESHKAFQKHGRVAEVIVKAGARPFLQSTLLSQTPQWKTTPPRGHQNWGEWLLIVKYSRKLRLDHEQYALKVAKHVSELLETCQRTLGGHVLFHDPLDDEGTAELGLCGRFHHLARSDLEDRKSVALDLPPSWQSQLQYFLACENARCQWYHRIFRLISRYHRSRDEETSFL